MFLFKYIAETRLLCPGKMDEVKLSIKVSSPGPQKVDEDPNPTELTTNTVWLF